MPGCSSAPAPSGCRIRFTWSTTGWLSACFTWGWRPKNCCNTDRLLGDFPDEDLAGVISAGQQGAILREFNGCNLDGMRLQIDHMFAAPDVAARPPGAHQISDCRCNDLSIGRKRNARYVGGRC